MSLIEGTVVKSTGSWYQVMLSDESIIECRIIGKFRLDGLKLTNPVAVGDKVMVEKEADDKGIIKEILPRTNYVVRQSPRKKHFVHFLASNIDQAMLIMTIKEPNLKQGFIDRFLVMTEPYDIPVHIIFNKADLYDEGDLNVYNYLKDIYTKIGYNVCLSSAVNNTGINELKGLLKDKVTLISGQSGVGKSSLINMIEDTIDLKTQDISDYSGKGQHTTTFAEMYKLSGGGFIIDTPGIKSLAFSHLEVMDVAHNFKELFSKSSECKFGNCTHRNEPHCAVKDAIEEGEISELRYFNYLQLLEEIEDQNYWERHSDI
jgi:ribosome biogenesis GTPase